MPVACLMRGTTMLLVFALSMAGCAEQEEDPDPPLGSTDQDGNRTLNVTNRAPLAELDVDTINGTAPLNVTFTLDGSDDDGDNLTWILSVGPASNATARTDVANGTTLPATVQHNFTQAGNFTAVLSVSDGTNTTQAAVDLTILAAAVDIPDPVVITGSALVPNPVLGSTLLCFNDGIDGDIHDIAPAGPGWSYTLEPGGPWALYWWSGGSYMSTASDSGAVPDGADQAEICSDAAAAGLEDYTLTLAHPDWEG